MIAIPARVLALVPPVTWSAESLKRAVNRLETESPVGFRLSSRMAASDEAPVAIGASLTAVTEADRTTVPLENRVVSPLVLTFKLPTVTGVDELSIRRTVKDGTLPL